MVNTEFPPINANLRPPQIISLPLFVSSKSTTSSTQHSNASSPDLSSYSSTASSPLFSLPIRPQRHSMDSSSSVSTTSSASFPIPRSTPSESKDVSKRSSFDPLSLPSTPLPEDFSPATMEKLRPRAHSHSHSYSSSSHASSSDYDHRHLHPSYASLKAEARPNKRASYSALTEGFASLSPYRQRESSVPRPRRTAELSEEVQREMRMFRD